MHQTDCCNGFVLAEILINLLYVIQNSFIVVKTIINYNLFDYFDIHIGIYKYLLQIDL